VRRPAGELSEDIGTTDVRGGSSVFYTIIFIGIAVLLVVAVIVQSKRRR